MTKEIALYISIGCNIAIMLLYLPMIYLKIRSMICSWQIKKIEKSLKKTGNKRVVRFHPHSTPESRLKAYKAVKSLREKY